jgi:hypothetical protein
MPHVKGWAVVLIVSKFVCQIDSGGGMLRRQLGVLIDWVGGEVNAAPCIIFRRARPKQWRILVRMAMRYEI